MAATCNSIPPDMESCRPAGKGARHLFKICVEEQSENVNARARAKMPGTYLSGTYLSARRCQAHL